MEEKFILDTKLTPSIDQGKSLYLVSNIKGKKTGTLG